MLFMRKLRKDKRGLSLIELVSALAILAIITTTIGGAMIFASNSYRQGSTDTALQQEAQFTINAIESLIIDATNEVTYSGGVLTINNQDYKYVINYNSGTEELTYSQFKPDGTKVVENELLAEHVTDFFLDDVNFKTARTVSIRMTLENGGSKFTSNYNVTSRNDPDAGDAPEVVAKINCHDFIVLEPQQEYILPISIVGPTNKNFSVQLEGKEDTNSTADDTIGGAKIKLGALEDGGDDGQLRLKISTEATDSTGSPFTKYVTIRVRRVKTVDLSPRTIVGADCAEGTTYKCTATAAGTFLEKQDGVDYDQDPQAYIDPNTFRWDFEIGDGSDWNDWLEVVGSREKPTIEIKLKKKLEIGDKITVRAVALHPAGVKMQDNTLTNKATRAAYNADPSSTTYQRPYGSAQNEFYIERSASAGNSDFKRGDEFYIQLYRDYEALVKQDWEKNASKYGLPSFDESKHGYNSGFAGNHHFRYYNADESSCSKAEGNDEDGYSYPYWRRAKDAGDDPKKIKFNAADLAYMKYMDTYTLDFIYSFKYNSNDNSAGKVFPLGFRADREEQNPDYVQTWIIDPVEVTFDTFTKDGVTQGLQDMGLLSPSASGIGTFDNPLVLKNGYEFTLHYRTIGPASNQKAGINWMLNQQPQLFDYAGSTWVPVEKGRPEISTDHQAGAHNERESGYLTYKMNNMFNNAGLLKGKVYKMVIGGQDGEIGQSNFKYGQIYTEQTQWETYADDNPTKKDSGRGIIYVKFE